MLARGNLSKWVLVAILHVTVGQWNAHHSLQNQTCCRRGQSCWPQKEDVAALIQALNPDANRSLYWPGHGPYTGAVPIASKKNQPLYGLDPIEPVYERHALDLKCYDSIGILETKFCKASTRNLANMGDGEPAFVVWPMTAQQVQVAVRFAKGHNLCVCVAAQGHDYLSRHSGCKDGILIRTGLMKDIEWSLGKKNRFAGAEGSVSLGAGLTFGEVHQSGSNQQPPSFVASGWVSTVGVVGWSTGGGHGPAGRSVGLGVDQILEVELVTPDGDLVTANATHNADLLWGVRGGGGPIFGVITKLTVKAHTTPKGGVSMMHLQWKGKMCGTEETQLHSLIDTAWKFASEADSRYSGMVWIQPVKNVHIPFVGCAASFHIILMYVFQGASSDATFQKDLAMWTNVSKPSRQNVTNFKDIWDMYKDDGPAFQFFHPEEWYIFPIKTPSIEHTPLAGIPSVALSGDTIRSGSPANLTKAHMADCKHKNPSYCVRHEIFNDIPGTARRPIQLEPNETSVSPSFHNADVHLMYFWPVTSPKIQKAFSELGDSCYFGESDATMPDWKHRYWGSNYDKLLKVKKQYDPNNLFNCHHCVASDLPRTPSRSALPTIV